MTKQKNVYGESEFVEKHTDMRTEIKVRNVGDKNPKSQIQFVVSEYDRRTNRTKLICFSISSEDADDFISAVKGDRK